MADPQGRKSLAQAVMAMRAGRLADAEALCREYLLHRPGSVPHLQVLGHALIGRQRFDEADREIRFALDLAPDYAPLREDLGSLRALQGDMEAAIRCFRKALDIDPSLKRAYRKLAQALSAAGRREEAEEAFEAYLEHDPEKAHVAAGAEHWRAGRFDEAEKTLRDTLRKNPDNVDAMRFLALLYLDVGNRLSDAEALLRRALALAPDFVQAMHTLGVVLADQGKWTDAVHAYRRLAELAPDDALAWAGLGNALSGAGDPQAAVNAYQRSLALRPDAPGVHMAAAHMLKTLGRQAEAVQAYRESIRQKPSLGESYWSLANLKVFRFKEEEVAAMREQVARDELAAASRVHFHFSLGKAMEDQDDYAAAWRHYRAGNELQRQLVDYDPVENELTLARIREVFSQEFVRERFGLGCDAADPIFVVGLPRTGSTLVEQILASHSQVEGTAELPNLSQMAFQTGKYRTDGLRYPETMHTLTERDWAAYGREYLRQVAGQRHTGRPRFIDKMPNNFAHIGWLKLILPNAKIIDTRRHPMDTCLGAYKQLFAKGQHFTYDELELAEYYRAYVETTTHWNRVLPGAVLTVYYEETVTDLEAQVRRILDFCGLPFEETSLRYYETERAVKTASSEQVRQPIYTDALGLWRRYGHHLANWREMLADLINAYPPAYG